jgi:hypothetical protein
MLGDFLAQSFDLGFFCGPRFLRPLGPDEIKSSIFDDHVSRAAGDNNTTKVGCNLLA